jgi:AcrR family transcriptional regulator
MTRSPAPPLDRRELLLRAGIEAFGTAPYDDVRVADIATRVGVAAGLPFHYFGSKRGYYLEVVAHIGVLMRDVLAVPEGLDPGDAVRTVLDAHLDWLGSHPAALRELLRGPMAADPEARVVYEQTRWEGMAHLLGAMHASELSAGARLLVEGWIALKDDVMLRWIETPVLPRDELVETLAQLLADVLDRVGEPATRVSAAAIRVGSVSR